MRARALEQGGRAEIAPELHIDKSPAKNSHPALVLARAAAIFQMRLVEDKAVPFERAVPAILEILAVVIGNEAIRLGQRKLTPGLDIVGVR